MDQDELKKRARRAVEGASKSQNDVAKSLDVDPSSVSRALRNAGLKHAAVQSRIIALLEGVPVERRSTYYGRRVVHEWVVDP